MSIKYSEVSTVEQVEKIEETPLPPRHTKHGKRNKESQEGDLINLKGRKRSLLYIQIILYTFLAMIAAIIIFYYLDERNQQQHMVAIQEDPLARFLQAQEQRDVAREPIDKIEADEATPSGEESFIPQEATGGDGQGLQEELEDTSLVETENPVREPSPPQEVEQKEEVTSSEPKIIAVHTVRPGETLYRITMQYYHSKEHLNYLATYNGIQDPTKDIKVGMTIKIPEKP